MASTPRRQSAYSVYSRNSTTNTTESSTIDGDAPKTTVERKKKKVPKRSAKNQAPVIITKTQLKRLMKSPEKTKTYKRSFIFVRDEEGEKISDDTENLNGADGDAEITNDTENRIMIDEDESIPSISDEDFLHNGIFAGNRDGICSPVETKIPVVPCGTKAADEAFKWLVYPITEQNFFEDIFEKHPYHLKRNNPTFYQGLFVANDLNRIIKENRLNYGTHVDIVAYIDGERVPVENELPVHSDFVWASYMEGYSVRMRSPQVYHKGLWKVCSLLQEFFSSSVGANIYLTPANSQGFPPHYDDIDAFILQIEGKKHWKVYRPDCEHDLLPRFSSKDLSEDEIGYPCLEKELVPGDLLYIPRGFVHQAKATNEHSLHITISTNQLNTWTDFFQKGLPQALETAAESNVEFRKSLPKDYFEHVGVAFAPYDTGEESKERKAFISKVKQLSKEILNNFDVDDTADAFATEFIHSCMPPIFNKSETDCSIHGNGHKFEDGIVEPISKLRPDTKIRWIRRRAFRLVIDENGCRLVNSVSNNKNSKEDALIFHELEEEVVPAVTLLFKKHPEYIAIEDLPIDTGINGKLDFAEGLYEHGLLMTKEPVRKQLGL